MTGRPDRVRRELALGWLQKGDMDYAVAQTLMKSMPQAAGAIGFHLQQAAEKHLKAFLTLTGKQPPRTHDLQELRSMVAPLDRRLAEQTGAVAALNPFAVVYRYPGPEPTASSDELEALGRGVRHLRETVAARIDAEKNTERPDA
ncbi:MAG: HEPN domain-containing protein [Armatimonadota bacterium]